jgi:hypothetical protein
VPGKDGNYSNEATTCNMQVSDTGTASRKVPCQPTVGLELDAHTTMVRWPRVRRERVSVFDHTGDQRITVPTFFNS